MEERLANEIMDAANNTGAVSYTHLDVYKRQDKICSSYETLHRDRVDWLLYHLQTRTANAK